MKERGLTRIYADRYLIKIRVYPRESASYRKDGQGTSARLGRANRRGWRRRRRCGSNEDDLLYSRAAHLLHGQFVFADLYGLADLWNMSEAKEDQPGEGFVIVRFG